MRVSKIFVTVDVVVWRKLSTKVAVLLIQRKNSPFKNDWAIPGGFVDENEDLADAAKRELLEETAIAIDSLQQVGAFGKPGRDPRGHTVSIAYVGRADDSAVAKAQDDAADAQWFEIDALPKLAFDHAEILQTAIEKFKL